MAIKSCQDLIVWQKAVKLAGEVYATSKLMPKVEECRLTSQLLRAVASVPANIAEGHTRGTRRDYARFIDVARGSLAEVETYLLLCSNVGLLKAEDVASAMATCDEVGRMLTSLLGKLRLDASNQSST